MARLRDLILADSPVGYWPLDDTDYTRVADISGNAYHGSFVGAPALNQLGPTDAQPCMVFNGTADGITLPSGAIVGATSPKTLMGLFNIDWSSDTKNRPLIFQGKSAGSTVFSIHAGFPGRSTTDTGNNFLFSLQNNSSNYGVGGNLRTYLANRWMLAAATYTGSVLNLYAGVLQPNPRLSLVASTLYAMSGTMDIFKLMWASSLSDSMFGTSGGSPFYVAGSACNAAIFNKELSFDRLSQYIVAATNTAGSSKVPVAVDIGGTPTQRRVRVFGRASGELLADELTDSSGNGAPTMYYDGAVDVIAIDDVGERWYASKVYAVNDLVIPATANGHWYKCTTAGTSGLTEPTWPTSSGGTVTDGSTVWTEQGTIAAPAVYGPFNPVPA